MARTLAQITKQIESLQKEADRVRESEVAGVVQRIKAAIAFYGLTAQDLFGPASKATAKGKKVPATKPAKARKPSAPAKYKDKASSKTWTGHGKRPGWFVKALEGGMKAEDMAV